MSRTIRNRFFSWLPFMRGGPIVPVVRLSGVIGYVTPLSPGLTLAGVARTLERAFAIKRAKAVAVVINSPGGSAVQSHLIHARIRALASEHKKPVIAFVEDVAASGGYMIACAADEIIADPSSIVGSIGVVSASFGFDKAIKKLGIERRVYTAGERKVILDPFRPAKADDVRHLKSLQNEIHAGFIDLVKNGRGKRLKGADKTLFSGEFWIAGTAQKLGLVDGIGDVRSVLRERYGKKVSMPLVAPSQSWFHRRMPGVIEPGDWAAGALSAIEARAWWARYGL
jgi:signal peptide peptidase SppA